MSQEDVQFRLQAGDPCHNFFMRTIDDHIVETGDFRGKKIWLAFYRYAGCPVCATHFAQVIEAKPYLEEVGITFIAVYDCHVINVPPWIRKNAGDRLRVVADNTQALHAKFGSNKSWAGLFNTQSFIARVKAGFEGYFEQNIDGSLNLMPAHFLIDENGTVAYAHYAAHPGDHINWKVVRDFATAKPVTRLNKDVNPFSVAQIPEVSLPEAAAAPDKTVVISAAPSKRPAVRSDFSVMYKWKVKLGHEAIFLKIWTELEDATKQQYNEYRGARLHLDSEQYISAYTVWDDKSSWERYWITKEQTLHEFVPLSLCVETTFEPQFFRSIFDSMNETGAIESGDDKTVVTNGN